MPLYRWSALPSTAFTADIPDNAIPDNAVAILPLGALEQHGPHLPLGTDHVIAEALATTACEKATADAPGLALYLLPTEIVGHSPEHESFPGTVSEPADALMARWHRIGSAVARTGIRRILMINAHGGQPQIMDLAGRALRRDHGLMAVGTSWPDLGMPDGLFPAEELRYGLHGGQIETALMLALAPDLVHLDKAADFANAEAARTGSTGGAPLIGALGPGTLAWMAEDLNPAGVTGNAAAATRDQGLALLSHLVAKLAAMIHDLSNYPLPLHKG
ncbi:MAG: creatininase family protein [Alphaproteobacteria bacterium]|nr:creatininase family protein [Alphaproteobacteria bacterium]